jgi:hypothetical protein
MNPFVFFLFSFQIRLTQFKKNSANVYMPGNFDVTQNACDVLKRNSTSHNFFKMIINNVDPGEFESYDKVLHPCPYTVSLQTKKKLLLQT